MAISSAGLGIAPGKLAAATTITVTTTDDAGTCPDTHGVSLRCAILQANATTSATIAFNIPAKDPDGYVNACSQICTISPNSALPAVSGASTTINGYTQPGASANTESLSAGDNATIEIQLDGNNPAGIGTGADGLDPTGTGDVVRGLSVTDFVGSGATGIRATGSGDVVTGDFIGLAPDGTAHGNATGLVCVGCTVGGTTNDARYVVGGNQQDGADVTGAGSIFEGNYIRTDPGGALARPNAVVGINAGSGVIIGGTATGTGNLISGNLTYLGGYAGDGIDISHSATGVTVEGNIIGLDRTGSTALSNNNGIAVAGTRTLVGGTTATARNVITTNLYGMYVTGSRTLIEGNYLGTSVIGTAGVTVLLPSGDDIDLNGDVNTTIGGTMVGAGNLIDGAGSGIWIEAGNNSQVSSNVIANSGEDGVVTGGGGVGASIDYNTIDGNKLNGIYISSAPVSASQNSIYGNGELGIDLNPTGVSCTVSSPPSVNGGVLCPVIQTVSTSSVSGIACAGCTVEVYIATNEADDQGHGEGKTYLGTTTANSSTGQWTLSLTLGQVASGDWVTATATTPSSPGPAETSEFAANMQRSPTAALLSNVRLARHGDAAVLRWRLENRQGVAGFNVLAAHHRLNRHLISVHVNPWYSYRVARGTRGPFAIEVVRADGRHQTIPAR